MQVGSVLKASSFSKSLVPTEVSCGQGDVKVSRVDVWKTVNSKLNPRKLNCYYKHVTDIQRHERQKTKFVVNAVSEFSDEACNNPEVFRPQMNGKSLGATLDVIYKYSRTYTLKGTVLSIISISLLAVQNLSDFTPSFFLGVLQAIVGGCLANLYVVGINQLSDVEIDKVNKPYLPLASGELPVRTGILLTSLYAFLGFGLGWSVKSWPLKLGLFLWYAFGTAYSAHVSATIHAFQSKQMSTTYGHCSWKTVGEVGYQRESIGDTPLDIPLLRWKRIPVLAATCLWSVQGAIIPTLFHLHAQTCIKGRSLLLSKHAIFVSGFMSIYGIVIALFKVFWISIWLLEMAFGMAIIIGLSSARIWIRSIMVIGHSILGFILWRNANLVDLKSNEAIESFYLFIWKVIITLKNSLSICNLIYNLIKLQVNYIASPRYFSIIKTLGSFQVMLINPITIHCFFIFNIRRNFLTHFVKINQELIDM
ncbi:putative homogentisate phytyltransferase [Helianthus debilis subsp. tardiflorus]